MTKMTQEQMFWKEHRKIADLNEAFMDCVNDPHNPLTNADLEALIKRNPAKYGRFSGLLGKLSS